MTHRFTLLELLLALATAAVVMAALLAAFSSSWRLQERGREWEEAAAPRRELRDRLRREFAAAVPPSGVLAGPLVAVSDTSGGWRQDDIEWVAAVGARNPDDTWGDLARLHYYLAEDEATGGWNLVRTIEQNLLAVETEDPEEVILAIGIQGLQALWFDGEDWLDEWDSTLQDNQLPKAVHIRLDFAETDGRTPAPLEVIVPFVCRTLSAEEES